MEAQFASRPMPIAIVALVACSLGCDEIPLEPVWDTALIEGQITEMGRDVGPGNQLAILVETNPGSPGDASAPGEDKVIFYLTRFTSIETDDPSADLWIHDLAIGMRVRVWPRGIMLTSYPGRVDAGVVQVISD